jgi:hypothetical protein
MTVMPDRLYDLTPLEVRRMAEIAVAQENASRRGAV